MALSGNSERFEASISAVLRQDEPIRRVVRETAAVAVIVRETSGVEEILLIRRSERTGDPWSGQVAFPGGRVETEDNSFRRTAERETREEVGIELEEVRFSGYLRAFQARTRSIWVVPSVFLLGDRPDPKPNVEVSSYRWVAFADLLGDDRRTTYKLERGGQQRTFPAFDLDGYLVWGLTERILTALVEAVGRSRPPQAETS
jgi:8-oxo-dGTP pyrophosphatase MutT (NUDIX family)